MGVTANQLRAALVSVGGLGGQGWTLETLAAGANKAMAESGITTSKGAAVFLSQCMVESAYWRTSTEYGSGRLRYDPHRGRGFIQVTFGDNYKKFGAWCKARGLVNDANYFYNNPTRLADSKWAWLTAVWYLSTHRHDLIKLANAGNVDAVGRGVHTGDAWASWYPNAPFHRTRIDHTRKAYNALLRAGVTAPGKAAGSAFWKPPKSVTMTVKEIQKAVGVSADGKYGAGTKKAVSAYQKKKLGLKGGDVDGLWGPATERLHLDAVKKKPAAKPKPAARKRALLKVDGVLGRATIKALQKEIGVRADGIVGPSTNKGMQRWLKVPVDGIVGHNTVRALQKKVGAKPVDGIWGKGTTKALQRYLNKRR